MNARQVVLVYIAQNPDIGEIRDGEQVGRVVQRFYSGRGSDVLLDDGSRYGRVDFNQRRDMLRVSSEKANALLGRLRIDVRLVTGVFGHLQVFLWRRSMGIEKLGAVQLGLRQGRFGQIGRASCRERV